MQTHFSGQVHEKLYEVLLLLRLHFLACWHRHSTLLDWLNHKSELLACAASR
jgi:hypothetical protein